MGTTPKPSSETARNRMRAAKSRDTEAEMKVRRLLHRMGLRYRVDYLVLTKPRRKADIVFTRARPEKVAAKIATKVLTRRKYSNYKNRLEFE